MLEVNNLVGYGVFVATSDFTKTISVKNMLHAPQYTKGLDWQTHKM